MTLVVDASVAFKWFVQETGSEAARAIVTGSARLVAPDLILSEVLNALWKAVRRGGAQPAQATRAAAALPAALARLYP